jgi:hypothetical protein
LLHMHIAHNTYVHVCENSKMLFMRHVEIKRQWYDQADTLATVHIMQADWVS